MAVTPAMNVRIRLEVNNMNGSDSYDCSSCGTHPCLCAENKQKIADGKIVLENLWQAMSNLPRWKRKIIKWFWPDIIRVADDLREYYWS